MSQGFALLVRGQEIISLSSSETSVVADGAAGIPIVPHMMDLPEGETVVTETWSITARRRSTDDLSDFVARLLNLLRYAWRYSSAADERNPVYLAVKAPGETETRFGTVHSVVEFDAPNPAFSTAIAFERVLRTSQINIRRFTWRSTPPGELPSALSTLTASDGPANPTMVHVANFRGGSVNLTHIYNYDDSIATFSANLFGTTGHAIWAVGAGTPALNDIIYFANNTPRAFGNIVIPITTAGVFTCDLTVEYWNGAWVAAPLGPTTAPGSTVYPEGTEDELFKIAGVDHVINVGGLSDWATTAINGITAYWIRVKISGFTSWTTTPITSASVAVYSQRSPIVSFPAALAGGDGFPLVLMRLDAPYGGDDDEGFSNLSKLIVGYKSMHLDEFESHLNMANTGLPTGWAVTLGTDATEVADPLGPNGRAVEVSFATQTGLFKRNTQTGTLKLGAWSGSYQAFLRAQQPTGAAGDMSVQVYFRERGTAVSDPVGKTSLVSLKAVGKGAEIIPLGLVQLPFLRSVAADNLSQDLIVETYAQRVSGVAVLRIYDLILIPVDEWSADYTDPIRDSTNGTSALRGNNALEIDSGIIAPRVQKMYRSSAGVYSPLETWLNGGLWPKFKPATAGRLFFLMGHFPSGGTWGTGPLIGTIGMHLAAKMYVVNRYQWLRGSRS